MTHQLVLPKPRPHLHPTQPATANRRYPGRPKAREGHATPLFVDQVCEVVRFGQSLGRERVWAIPVKWLGRGVPAAGFGKDELIVLVGGET